MENKQLNLSEPENIMGTMDVNPLLIKLSIPMMISMLVQALYNVVDSIFVARVSENALTAVSLAFSLQNMMFAVGIGTGVGVNALLSKSLGEKNQSRANKTAENGLFLALCSYLVFLVLGLTVVRPYFYAQTADADIAEHCRSRSPNGHPQPGPLCRTHSQRKQPEAEHPRAEQGQISPFHSSYLPA